MIMEHWFWGLLTLAVLVWYSWVTAYVAIRGVKDIRDMLKHLKGQLSATPGTDNQRCRPSPSDI